jgi:hypothetical protein
LPLQRAMRGREREIRLSSLRVRGCRKQLARLSPFAQPRIGITRRPWSLRERSKQPGGDRWFERRESVRRIRHPWIAARIVEVSSG